MNEEFLTAARVGSVDRVRELLPRVRDVAVRVRGLMMAIACGSPGVARFLLDSGVPPEHESCKDSYYPLHFAVKTDDPEMLALLLAAGAHPNVVNHIKSTPLSYARCAFITRRLLDAGADCNAGQPPPLVMAAMNSRIDVLSELLAHPGVDLNVRYGQSRESALHAAMSMAEWDSPSDTRVRNRIACVEALVAAGADLCAVTSYDKTPLDVLALNEIEGNVPLHLFKIATIMVAAGAFQWDRLPANCPYLEAALMPVWKKAPEELPQLFQHLTPEVQAKIQATLRGLHHAARPFKGLEEALRMEILSKCFE